MICFSYLNISYFTIVLVITVALFLVIANLDKLAVTLVTASPPSPVVYRLSKHCDFLTEIDVACHVFVALSVHFCSRPVIFCGASQKTFQLVFEQIEMFF